MKTVRANWRTAILVCRKCSKKVGGGFGAKGRTPLIRALREEAAIGRGRKAAAGLIEVGCLKICPKHAVTVVDTAAPGAWLVVKPGTPIADVAARLGLTERHVRHPELDSGSMRDAVSYPNAWAVEPRRMDPESSSG